MTIKLLVMTLLIMIITTMTITMSMTAVISAVYFHRYLGAHIAH